MTPVLVTPPAIEPLALDEARAWLRLDDTAEDAAVSALIVAARMTVERQSGRLLVAQAWRLIADTFPADGLLRLPLAPVRAVTQIRVLDAAGAATVVPAAGWRSDLSRDPPRVVLTAPPPLPGRSSGGIEIDLACGYGPAAADVPEPLRHAVRLLVARWFERRGDEPDHGASLPADVALLLAPFRSPRLA